MDLRRKVASEAAVLLYMGAEKEYRQAKLKAASTLGAHFLPSNREVALELDRTADEKEGNSRKERLIQMRREALEAMTVLKPFSPLLIGSVWRGTIRPGSDIDIAVYRDEPEKVPELLAERGYGVSSAEWVTVTKHGKTENSYHVHLASSDKNEVEVVVRSSEEANKKRTCEIFGDELKGIDLQELTKLLTTENPAQQFIPA